MTDEELVDLYNSYRGLFYLKNCNTDSELQKYNITEEDAYRNINILYRYNYGEMLDPEDENDRNDLFELANKVCKYTLLNECIDDTYMDYASLEKDKYVLNNFDKMIDISDKLFEETKSFDFTEDPKLPYLSEEDLEMYLIDFLDYVDKSGEYLDLFYELKKNGRLFYLDEMSEEKRNSVLGAIRLLDKKERDFYWYDDRLGHFIFLTRNHTIDDFRKLAHEFIHYATSYKNEGNRPSAILLEFPPIFYELLACHFLRKKGYSSEDVQNLSMLRLAHISGEVSSLGYINPYLRIYLKQDEPISLDDDIEYRKDQILTYKNNLGLSDNEPLTSENGEVILPEEMASDICDMANSILTVNPRHVIHSYPYIVGFELANKYISKAYTNRESTLNGMKYMTFHLPNINSEILFDSLDKDKVKVKKMG